jgi:hypothetical protein
MSQVRAEAEETREHRTSSMIDCKRLRLTFKGYRL